MFHTFSSWADLHAHIAQSRTVYYHAPLDTAPRPVRIRKAFKNGKLRLDAGEVAFTADPSHLARFRFTGRRVRAPRIIIELGHECTSVCLLDGSEATTDAEVHDALFDCTRSGDCQDACEYVLDNIGVEWRIVAKNAAGEYENRLATAEEKEAVARAIYFESESDFADERTAETYLVWDAAHGAFER